MLEKFRIFIEKAKLNEYQTIDLRVELLVTVTNMLANNGEGNFDSNDCLLIIMNSLFIPEIKDKAILRAGVPMNVSVRKSSLKLEFERRNQMLTNCSTDSKNVQTKKALQLAAERMKQVEAEQKKKEEQAAAEKRDLEISAEEWEQIEKIGNEAKRPKIEIDKKEEEETTGKINEGESKGEEEPGKDNESEKEEKKNDDEMEAQPK